MIDDRLVYNVRVGTQPNGHMDKGEQVEIRGCFNTATSVYDWLEGMVIDSRPCTSSFTSSRSCKRDDVLVYTYANSELLWYDASIVTLNKKFE
ncbi:MAG: hypothetical protein JW384_02095 [Nitrosomonadaceae bacterium]|nr:hypothetical protein [Nitrosomonadaceae bacterium]